MNRGAIMNAIIKDDPSTYPPNGRAVLVRLDNCFKSYAVASYHRRIWHVGDGIDSFDANLVGNVTEWAELPGETDSDGVAKRVEITTLRDGSLVLSCGSSGMKSDLVFASGAMAGDPWVGKQREILEWIASKVNVKL